MDMKDTAKMAIQVNCPVCGLQFNSYAFDISGNVRGLVLDNCRESCPRCGSWANIQSGSYNFIDGVLTAFSAASMTYEKLTAFKKVVQKANAGDITDYQAISTAETVDPALSRLLQAARTSGISFDRILAVLAFLLAFWQAYSSDTDVRAALKESRNQTELSQKILSELRQQNLDESTRQAVQITAPSPSTDISQLRNRHERRKAKAIQRRLNKTSNLTTK